MITRPAPTAASVAAGIAFILSTAVLVDSERTALQTAVDGSFGITVDGKGFAVIVVEEN